MKCPLPWIGCLAHPPPCQQQFSAHCQAISQTAQYSLACRSTNITSTLHSSEERRSSAQASRSRPAYTPRNFRLLFALWPRSHCHALCTSTRIVSPPLLAFAPTRTKSTVGSGCAWQLVHCSSSFTISWSNGRALRTKHRLVWCDTAPSAPPLLQRRSALASLRDC